MDISQKDKICPSSIYCFKRFKKKIDNCVKSVLSKRFFNETKRQNGMFLRKILNVMNYAVSDEAKRLRPILTLIVCKVCGGNINNAIYPAVAIELIHNYSLVHDDLPSMDNDDFRRGKQTVHKAFGEAMAVLAGDALLTYAFNILANKSSQNVIKEVSNYCGLKGMISGQVGDIYWNTYFKNVKKERLIKVIHKQKTAAMFALCCKIGAMCAGANNNLKHKMEKFGWLFGLSFQIADDLSDYINKSNKKTLTFPAVFGLNYSKLYLKKNIYTMKNFLKKNPNSTLLSDFVDYVFNKFV